MSANTRGRGIARTTLLAACFACVAPRAVAAQVRAFVFADTGSARIQVLWPDADSAVTSIPASIVYVGRDAGIGGGAADPGNDALWAGALPRTGKGTFERTVTGLHPRLWSPDSPNRYALVVHAGAGALAGAAAGAAADTVRFGFRLMEMRKGRLLLNGAPIFLRGNAINPPGRTIPDSLDENPRFVADYVKYLKSIHVNTIRTSATSQVWMDACDSLGMLLYQGLYGTPKGGTKSRPPQQPFDSVLADYREVLEPLVNHPSVVVYVLSNELDSRDIIQAQQGADGVAAYMQRVYRALRKWDSTRVYIGNAGYGYGRSGDICDMHHYWGYYYNTVLSYYTLRDPHTCWRTPRAQPLTVSEGVASYTGADGRFNLVSDSKLMSAAMEFGGHAPVAEQPARDSRYQAFAVGNAIEIMRRTRAENPYLAGLMPFTNLFSEWWRIHSFADMTPSPAATKMAISYQPVLLSWENWTPQVYAGTTLRPTAHVVNDDSSGRGLHGLELRWTLREGAGMAGAETATAGAARAASTVRDSGLVVMGDMAYFGTIARQLAIPLAAALPHGEYVLEGTLFESGRELSHNRTNVFVARRDYAVRGGLEAPAAGARRVVLYDPAGHTGVALRRLGIGVTTLTSPASLRAGRDVLVVGAQGWDAWLGSVKDDLKRFVRAGGRVLVLAQDPAHFDTSWLGARIAMQTAPADAPGDRRPGNPFRNGMAVNPEWTDHPVFDGIDRDRLFLWSDPNGWTERSSGLPAVYPVTSGFVLQQPDDLAHVALLADYGRGLEGVAMAEIFDGKGSVLLSGFDLVRHAGVDPAADRLLANCVRYEASAAPHHEHPLVTGPIVWGDYGSEHGVAVDVYNGLLVNTVPVVPEGLEAKYPRRVDANGYVYAGARGGWNTRPAIEYVARGRRPFGPFSYDLFGTPRLSKTHAQQGTGRVWLRVPAATRVVSTTVENPSDTALTVRVTVNGVMRERLVPRGARVAVDVPLAPSDVAGAAGDAADVELAFTGDRRLVLVETVFR